jgi:hypothetical protein
LQKHKEKRVSNAVGNGEVNANLTVCLLDGSSSEKEKKEIPRTPEQRIVDRHEELHRQYVGVGYIGNPMKDYQAACQLVKAFPDMAMQDAIVIYGLNDPSEFMSNGTRTLAKIASRASDYAQDLKARKLA